MNNLVTVWIALNNRVRGPNCNYVPRAKRTGHKFERKLKTRFRNLQVRFLLSLLVCVFCLRLFQIFLQETFWRSKQTFKLACRTANVLTYSLRLKGEKGTQGGLYGVGRFFPFMKNER